MTTEKPTWKNAPVWANWLSQDQDGKWFWSEYKPVAIERDGCFSPAGNTFTHCKLALRGEVNNQWMNTLEHRPEAAQ